MMTATHANYKVKFINKCFPMVHFQNLLWINMLYISRSFSVNFHFIKIWDLLTTNDGLTLIIIFVYLSFKVSVTVCKIIYKFVCGILIYGVSIFKQFCRKETFILYNTTVFQIFPKPVILLIAKFFWPIIFPFLVSW